MSFLGIAGALFDRPVPDARNRLAAGIVKSFFSYYDSLAEKRFLKHIRAALLCSAGGSP